MGIGSYYCFKNKFHEPRDIYSQALDLLIKHHPDAYDLILNCWNNIGYCWHRSGSYKKAMIIFQEHLRIAKSSDPSEYSFMITLLLELGDLHRMRREYQLSLQFETQCYLTRQQILPLNHLNIGRSFENSFGILSASIDGL